MPAAQSAADAIPNEIVEQIVLPLLETALQETTHKLSVFITSCGGIKVDYTGLPFIDAGDYLVDTGDVVYSDYDEDDREGVDVGRPNKYINIALPLAFVSKRYFAIVKQATQKHLCELPWIDMRELRAKRELEYMESLGELQAKRYLEDMESMGGFSAVFGVAHGPKRSKDLVDQLANRRCLTRVSNALKRVEKGGQSDEQMASQKHSKNGRLQDTSTG